MTFFPIHPETLKTLYERGFIAPEALTAIAPIQWLAEHYPELLDSSEKLVEVLNAIDENKAIAPKSKTCDRCIHFSKVHECCMTRIDDESTYLPVTSQTPACQDFEGVELPAFVTRRQQ